MKRVVLALAGAVVAGVVAKRLGRARQVYAKEVASGARPIEAVGTAVAAFVGVTPPDR